MYDFEKARIQMVDAQLRTNDVTNHAVLRAFLTTPRERFTDGLNPTLSYMDEDIPLGEGGRILLAPRTMGRMIQALEISQDDDVLVIGAGTGYSAALISRLCDSVIAVEEEEALYAFASEAVLSSDSDGVAMLQSDLKDGYSEQGPYAKILIDGAVSEIPAAVSGQLADGGRLVTLKRDGAACYTVQVERFGDDYSTRRLFDAHGLVLPGFEAAPAFVF